MHILRPIYIYTEAKLAATATVAQSVRPLVQIPKVVGSILIRRQILDAIHQGWIRLCVTVNSSVMLVRLGSFLNWSQVSFNCHYFLLNHATSLICKCPILYNEKPSYRLKLCCYSQVQNYYPSFFSMLLHNVEVSKRLLVRGYHYCQTVFQG